MVVVHDVRDERRAITVRRPVERGALADRALERRPACARARGSGDRASAIGRGGTSGCRAADRAAYSARVICGSASIALPTSKNVPFTCAASRMRMIGSVAVRFGPSSKVSATSPRAVGPVRDAAAEPVRRRASPRRRTAAKPMTTTSRHAGGRACVGASPVAGSRAAPAGDRTRAPRPRAAGRRRVITRRSRRSDRCGQQPRPRRARRRAADDARAVAAAGRGPSEHTLPPRSASTMSARSPIGAVHAASLRFGTSRLDRRGIRFPASWNDGRN